MKDPTLKIEARELRSNGWHLTDIAEKLGVSASAVHRWTSGIQNPYCLTGKKIGRWTIGEYVPHQNTFTGAYYRCTCECGKEKDVHAGSLRKGKSLSCGCAGGRYADYGFSAPLNYRHRTYKTGAKKRGLEFALSKELFEALILADCHYCGCPPNIDFTKWRHPKGGIKTNGIDRIDSGKGYFPDNVVTCCTMCNRMKSTTPYQDFIAHIEAIHACLNRRKPSDNS